MTRSIEIYTRTADTATIDGRLIHRGYFPTIYDAAIAEAQSMALDHGRSVLIKAIDGVGETGTTWIELHQDGKLEPAKAPEEDTADTPSVQRRRRRAAEPAHQDDDESEFYSPVAAPPREDGVQDRAPALRPVPQDPSPRYDVPSWAPPAEGAFPAAGEQQPPDPAPVPSESQAPAMEPVQDQPRPQPQQLEPRTGPILVADRPQQFASPPREPYAQQQGPSWPSAHPQQQPSPGVHHQGPQHAAPWMPQQPMAPQSPPSLADLRASRPDAPESPATSGWRGGFNRATGGLLKLSPSEEELRLRRARDAVQRSLRGPRTVVVINTKGGGGKTTAVYSLAATFGQARGGYVLGWDNNETRGTLAWRSAPARHTNTAVDLLRDLERFEDPRNARVGDLDNYVRAQGSAQFDVLASDENAASAASIDDAAFRALHRSLSRFYRILVIDTGNNVKAPNWGAAVDLADQLVIVSSVREDTAGGASWTLDHLTEIGLGDKVRNAVTILSAPKAAADPDQRAMQARFREHFAARTRTVLDVPFDPALVDGDSIVFEALSPATRQAWLIAAAAIAEGL